MLTMAKEATTGLSVQQARDMLRAADLRSTASRLAVLQHLAQFDKPLSHAEVADHLPDRVSQCMDRDHAGNVGHFVAFSVSAVMA